MSQNQLRVVIAEDEALIRLDLKEMLEEEGYSVVAEAGDGESAVGHVTTLRPDLAILDIKMPVLDGISAAERIAAVIGCTAFEAGPDRQPFVAEFDIGVAEVKPAESAAKALETAAAQASERQAS